MKIEIAQIWTDSDDPNFKEFTFIGENTDFKTTVAFYEYADAFKKFAKELADFPFKNKHVVFKAGDKKSDYLELEASLKDSAGRVSLAIKTRDNLDNSVQFSSEIEPAALIELAAKLSRKDFNDTEPLTWSSKK